MIDKILKVLLSEDITLYIIDLVLYHKKKKEKKNNE